MSRYIKSAVFCVLATTLTASWQARAETIFLKCSSLDVLAVDLTNRTVNNYAASITPVAIDWHQTNENADVIIHIDRTAGTLSVSGTYFTANGNIPIPPSIESCALIRAPATKF